MIKRIDKLLGASFIPPFFLAFFIAMFVLLMQQLWKYIDDIIGKGASIWMILEFIFYLSVSLIPTAMPVAILLSSLMIMGNFSERYELTSLKSAGVSLWRIMRSMIVITIGISIFSFFCSNNILPVAMLKFKARLINFKTQKLALSLEKEVFNDDFKNYAIRIKDKNPETGEINGILMYDHTNPHRNKTKVIMA